MNRQEISTKLIELSKIHNNILLQFCTGLGKSKIVLDIINNLQKAEKAKILLIIAEKAHRNNWIEEFEKWNFDYSNITIECYASLKKYKNTDWNICIMDEGHHIGSDLRLNILKTIKIDKTYILSATFPKEIFENLQAIIGRIEVTTISLNKAIEWGILPYPKVFLIPLKLDEYVENSVIQINKGKKHQRVHIICEFKDRWKYMNTKNYPNIELTIKCTEREKYDYLSQNFDYWKKQYFETGLENHKTKWLSTGSERKRFLGNSKSEKVQHLLCKLKDSRYICFCASIDQAELLGKEKAVHSRKSNSLDIITKFNNKEINNIFAVSMVQEGMNLADIEAGIITQLDGYDRGWKQKIGRIFRAKEPIQYIFYYENTKDEDYLTKVLEGIDNSYIQYIHNIKTFKPL